MNNVTQSDKQLWQQHPNLGVRVSYETRSFYNMISPEQTVLENINVWILYWGKEVMVCGSGNCNEQEANSYANKLVKDILENRIKNT